MVDFSLQINQEIWVQVTWRKSTLFICINFWHYNNIKLVENVWTCPLICPLIPNFWSVVFTTYYCYISFYHSKHKNDCKHYELAFKYGVWPCKVNILKYAESRRVSFRSWDNTQCLYSIFRDLDDLSRLYFTIIPDNRKMENCTQTNW